MKKKKRNKEGSREKILIAAAKLFRKNGYHATGVDELMEEAQLTAGAFYAHFKSKQDLFDHVIEYMTQTSKENLTRGLDLEKGKQEIVKIIHERYVSALHRDHPELGCAVPAIAGELHRHSKKAKEILGNHLRRWIDLYENKMGGANTTKKREESIRLIALAVGSVLLARLVDEELSLEILKAGRKI